MRTSLVFSGVPFRRSQMASELLKNSENTANTRTMKKSGPMLLVAWTKMAMKHFFWWNPHQPLPPAGTLSLESWWSLSLEWQDHSQRLQRLRWSSTWWLQKFYTRYIQPSSVPKVHQHAAPRRRGTSLRSRRCYGRFLLSRRICGSDLHDLSNAKRRGYLAGEKLFPSISRDWLRHNASVLAVYSLRGRCRWCCYYSYSCYCS